MAPSLRPPWRGLPLLAAASHTFFGASALADVPVRPAPAADSTSGEPGDAGSNDEPHEEPRDAAPSDPDALPKRREPRARDGFTARLVEESAVITPVPQSDDFAILSLHGQYQFRLRAQTDLPLEPPVRGALPATDGSDPKDPGLLGQNAYLYHWLRLRGQIAIGTSWLGVAELDLPRGMIVGDRTQFVGAARDPGDEFNWYDIHPRQLYVEARTPIGLFRLGQQTSHFGEGMVANDGDHSSMFGDPVRGALVERLLFLTKPGGPTSPWYVGLAGDVVFEDNTADLLGNSPDAPADLAAQAVIAMGYREDFAELGLYGVFRHQGRTVDPRILANEEDRNARMVDESTNVGVIDVAGNIRGKMPGSPGYVFAKGEAALVLGETSFLRGAGQNSITPTSEIPKEVIRSFGANATLGYVHTDDDARGAWGNTVVELEWGYASGDADPFDGVSKRFTFDTNHNVGLVLFDQVLGWKTARSATIAQDPRLVARPSPGLQYLPSQGGIFGATYLNPRVLFRPIREVDVKLGVVWANATSDLVDPYQAGALGTYRNFDGGDPNARDLGVEIDTGGRVRVALEDEVSLELGAEGGVLFPGRAFDDEAGRELPTQLYLNTMVGLQF